MNLFKSRRQRDIEGAAREVMRNMSEAEMAMADDPHMHLEKATAHHHEMIMHIGSKLDRLIKHLGLEEVTVPERREFVKTSKKKGRR